MPEDLCTLAQANRHLAKESWARQDWSGLPVPVPGLDLILEPRYKHGALSDFRWKECFDEDGTRHAYEEEPDPRPSNFRIVNSWWNHRHQFTVYVAKDERGRASLRFFLESKGRLAVTIRTLEAAAAWPVEAEQRALEKLGTLVPEDLLELYQLTGHFAEVSKRSNLTYLFRKGRPTIALRQDERWSHALCALCLHPIGYYGETYAGVMCPTDEVIAHLLMMRGCEEKFWANANQHPIDHPNAGV